MIVRMAFFRGTIHPGHEQAFEAFVLERLKPMWLRFPGLRDLSIQFERARDDGAPPIPLVLSMRFDDWGALQHALADPIRMESRAVTAELLTLFDGKVEHHVFEA
ncbi:hypothetical protein [Aureimonas frigidaquae]|uniref:EthD protein n=1 Tax=Aureimonas frigidaquae TaxID=424757 RepID=A0A0P0Z071_9HYPH|nr:hypothetical protein [Aureimonas frigidaquae]BAT27275.1 EthD protein [Aureimonas frigidaquae]